MKISELIKELAEVQMARGDVNVMMEFMSIPDEEIVVLESRELPTHFEAIEGVSEVQIGFAFYVQLST